MKRSIFKLLAVITMELFIAPGFASSVVAAADDREKPSVGPLDGELFDGLPARPVIPSKPAAPSDNDSPPRSDALEKQEGKKPKERGTVPDNNQPPVEPPLVDGEDVGPKGAVEILKMIAERMDLASKKLADKKRFNRETVQLQEQVTLDLARLAQAIERQMKQNSGQQTSPSPADAKPSSQSTGDPKPQNSGDGRAADSAETGEKSRKTGTQGPDVNRAMQSAWGQLPPHMRASLPMLSPESFLPGYRKLIEDYYLRLAEPGVD